MILVETVQIGMGIRGTIGGYPVSRLGIPVVPLRLFFGLIFTLPIFSFFAVMVHIRFGWFVFHRQVYVILGAIVGVLTGYLEASFISEKLRKEIETVAWFLLPLGLITWVLPLACIYFFVGANEFLPFGVYYFFPSIEAFSITSGILFRRFEKKQNVKVFMFFFPRVPYPKYWIETPKTLKIELFGFLDAMADKEISWALYYGKYAKQLKSLIQKLPERKHEVNVKVLKAKELIENLLDEIIKFNQESLKIAITFVASCAAYIAYMFFAVANNYFGAPQTYGPAAVFLILLIPFILILVYPFLKRRKLTKEYERKSRFILDKIDAESLAVIKDLVKLAEMRRK